MTRQNAILLVVLGAVFMSTSSVYLRFVETAGGFQILFYRSLSLCVALMAIICLRRRVPPLAVLKSIDRKDAIIGVMLSGAFTGFVFAILNTSVASALFMLTASPLLAASLAWVWIREKPHPFTWISMALACCGILFMVGDGVGTGRTLGNVCALFAAACFAFMLVFARRCRKSDILGGTFVAGVLSGIYGFVFSLLLNPVLASRSMTCLLSLRWGCSLSASASAA